MKNFKISLKCGCDTGNSELDMIIDGYKIQQANVYSKIPTGGLKIEERNQEEFIEKLESNLIVSFQDSPHKDVEPGDYSVGNYALSGNSSVRNVQLGAGNNKADSDVCYVSAVSMLAAYAVKKAYYKDREITDINVKVDMAVALPINQYTKAEGERYAEKFMNNEHKLVVKTPEQNYHVTIEFGFVKTIAEGVTSTFALISPENEGLFNEYNKLVSMNNSGEITGDSLYKEELHISYFQKKKRRILHASIGEGTCEIIITDGLKFDENFVLGLNNGVGRAIKKVLPTFNKELRTNFSRQSFSEILKDKEHKYHEDAVKYMSSPLADEARTIHEKIADELESADNNVDLILVYGGGSILMRKHLEDKLETLSRIARIKLLYVEQEDAVMLEANGLYNFVNSALFKKLKEMSLA